MQQTDVCMSEEELIALAERARLIADLAYDAHTQTRDCVEKSMQRIQASLALLARVRALGL
jgi:hypothetical protein